MDSGVPAAPAHGAGVQGAAPAHFVELAAAYSPPGPSANLRALPAGLHCMPYPPGAHTVLPVSVCIRGFVPQRATGVFLFHVARLTCETNLCIALELN